MSIEHEWSDIYIESIILIVDRIQINYSQPVDNARLRDVDLKVLADALGYDMVKRNDKVESE